MAALKAPTTKDYEQGLPTSKQEAIERGLTRFIGSDGQERVIRNYGSKKFPTGNVVKASSRGSSRGTESRRAATNEQTLTKQDYLDYAKKNGYSAEQANQLYELNETKLANYRGQKSAELHYEHLAPTRSPMRGGVEHYRNIVMMQGGLNIGKSDKLASTEAMRKAGVPLTKQGALYADFNNLPLPTDQKQIDIILKDIASQPKPKTTKEVRQALKANPAVEPVGEKFALKTMKKTAAGLAAGGAAALYGGMGTAASAAEVGVRGQIAEQTKNPVDRLQQGIAGASLAADVASYAPPLAVPASIASGVLDVTNVGIDTIRGLMDEVSSLIPKINRPFARFGVPNLPNIK